MASSRHEDEEEVQTKIFLRHETNVAENYFGCVVLSFHTWKTAQANAHAGNYEDHVGAWPR